MKNRLPPLLIVGLILTVSLSAGSLLVDEREEIRESLSALGKGQEWIASFFEVVRDNPKARMIPMHTFRVVVESLSDVRDLDALTLRGLTETLVAADRMLRKGATPQRVRAKVCHVARFASRGSEFPAGLGVREESRLKKAEKAQSKRILEKKVQEKKVQQHDPGGRSRYP